MINTTVRCIQVSNLYASMENPDLGGCEINGEDWGGPRKREVENDRRGCGDVEDGESLRKS